MRIAVAKETLVNESRVALVPDIIAKLVKQGLEIRVEAGAGEKSFFFDGAYEQAGAKIISDSDALWRETEVLLKIGVLEESEVDKLQEGSIVISFLNPLGNPTIVKGLAERKVTAFSMELIPRTSRAQVMDALSSQANIGGYILSSINGKLLYDNPEFVPATKAPVTMVERSIKIDKTIYFSSFISSPKLELLDE